MQSLTKSETECPWLAQLKPWNGLGTYLDHLATHYALMAMNKGTIDHARHMTKLLKSDFPTLPTLIVQRLKVLHEQRRIDRNAENSKL
jgi:hypothetical protein